MTTAKNYFLNERQELSAFDRGGGGRAASYVRIDWADRATTLARTLRQAVGKPAGGRDPLTERHHFVVAIPVATVEKHSTSKKAAASGGIVSEIPSFGGAQSKVFRKLGLDLIETMSDGSATVHWAGSPDSVIATTETLVNASERERSRWISFQSFASIPMEYRIDSGWLETLPAVQPTLVWIRFQPTLSRVDVQVALQEITAIVAGPTTRLLRAGREFSGRYWCAGALAKDQVLTIARGFASVQTIHPRYSTPLAAVSRRGARPQVMRRTSPSPQLVDIASLPTVAIVDSGIPENHVTLAPYRRPGYRNPDLDPFVKFLGNHGSNVASCAVFGHIEANGGSYVLPPPRCRVMDVMVSLDAKEVDVDIITPAIEAIVGTSPDVRVFNLSFGGAPIDLLPPTRRREELVRLQDLDNLAFARDILIVAAAGNSEDGIAPSSPYPNHIDDPRWALGATARSFNGIVCGGYVGLLGSETIGGQIGAPSPFTRIGPGLCESPSPGFSAPAGDVADVAGTYQTAYGTGVGVVAPSGLWEDVNGTSIAAPFIAAEAAHVFQELARHCPPQALPFAGTVKAWMTLSARREPLTGAHERLAKRTLGAGLPSAEGLRSPPAASATFIWQTLLQGPGTVSRVQVPIPLAWIRAAAKPRLRLVASWNTPVNTALTESWGCRKVGVKVRPFGEVEALRGGGQAKGAFPLVDRRWDISLETLTEHGFSNPSDYWTLEVDYEEIGAYPPAMTVSPQQRVGVALALSDESDSSVSPHPFVQALPVAIALDRLPVIQSPILVPISIKQ